MYPAGELSSLSRRKALLRAKISIGRLHCVVLATDVVRPLDWIDRVVAQWRKISPVAKLAALPLGLLLRRGLLPGKKLRLFSGVARLLPLVLGAVKFFKTRQRA